MKRTQHDTTTLNCWNSACNFSKRVNLKQLPRVVFLKTQDAHRARASELESTGTARSIRCRNWHQVETDWKRRISELNIFDVTTCQNLSKLFRQLIAAVWTRCTCAQFAQSCHLRCPPWGWQPPIWWTFFHLWPAVPRHGNCVNEHLFLGGLQHGVFFHGLNYAEEWPELRIQISTTFAQTWRTGRPVPCLYDCSLSKVHDVWHWSTIFEACLFLAFF